ncbi:MAG TPA: alpha/beta hydrolase [Acidimicrobiia bacterium]|nr:alpha/beta hydrolase [Acidimicrobiia bacterium]
MSFVLLVLALVAFGLTLTGLHRPAADGSGAPWLLALAAGELTVVLFAGHVVLALAARWLGWTAGWLGGAALAVLVASAAGLVVVQRRTAMARPAIAAGVAELLGEPVVLPAIPLRRVIDPRPRAPLGVVRQPSVRYGPDARHLIDVIAGPGGAGPAPVLLQVHGGGWTGGRLNRQGRPLLHRMAQAGWIVAEATYRLSPAATFPDHLVDVKRAIGWIRRHAVDLGADPSFVAITGGSAGGHLAALAALTGNDPAFQPGFEAADTSVQACVPVYGVHDLLDATGRAPKWPYLVFAVMKSHPTDDPDRWALGSPVDMATPDRPPFLVVHGGADTLVFPEDSRRLVAELRRVGGPAVGHVEIPWATHGFDTFGSVRALHHAEGVAMALDALWADHRAAVGTEEEWS